MRATLLYRIASLLLLSAVVFLTGLTLYLKQRPEELAALLTREIEARSGLACDVRSVGVVLFPKPMLALVDVDIKDAQFTLSIPYVTIWPRIIPLLRGEFRPSEIFLFHARYSTHLENTRNTENMPQKDGDAPSSPASMLLPPLLEGCALVLRNSSVHLETPKLTLKAEDIDGRVLLDSRSPQGDLVLSRVSLAYVSRPALTLSDVRLELRAVFQATREKTAVKLAEDTGQKDVHVQTHVQGNVSAQGTSLPMQARLAIRGTHDAFKVEELKLHLADDVFTLAGLFEQKSTTPAFSGRLEFERFSLPRYFAFARRLPPGIQHSLDRLSGHADFSLDAQGLAATNLLCTTSHGAVFTGSGGMKNFATPEIFLDVQSTSVNLDEKLPEIIQSGVTPPEYGHEPLIGNPNPPGHAALPSIGYDIRIRAEHVLVASSQAQRLALRCSPGAKGPLLDFDAVQLFDGQAQGSLAVSGEDGAPLSYALKLHVQNLNLKSMKRLLPTKHLLEGTISGNADLRFEGNSPAAALSRLNGAFSLRLADVFHTAADAEEGTRAERVPFPVRALSGTFQSAGTHEDRLVYTGKWQAGIQDGDWRLDAQLDGPLSIALEGFFPLRLSRVPGVLQLRRTTPWKGFMPQGLHMECSGKFSLDSEHADIAVEDARARLFDCDLTGQLRGKYAKESFEFQGRIGVSGSNLRQTLTKLGMKDLGLNPALLKTFSGAAAVAHSPGKLALSEMKGRIDQSHFSGALSGQWAQRPVWQGNVRLDTLDLQSYLDSGPRPKEAKVWDVKLLQDFDAKGVVEVQRLRLLGMQFRQARSHVQLSGGVLEFSPVSADLYEGTATAQIRLNAQKGLGIQANVQANRINLRGFSDDRGTGAVYEGKASAQLELTGFARSSADIPAGLSGSFFCEIGSGSMQSRQKGGASPIRFDRIVISGPVERGVFRSERFQLDGPTLNARGGGWVNMPEETLDLKLEVRMTGLPAFPMRVHGKLDKPQTSVQAGQALVQAMGKLGLGVMDGIETMGSGLLGVIGSVLSVPFKMLK